RANDKVVLELVTLCVEQCVYARIQVRIADLLEGGHTQMPILLCFAAQVIDANARRDLPDRCRPARPGECNRCRAMAAEKDVGPRVLERHREPLADSPEMAGPVLTLVFLEVNACARIRP